MSIYREYLCENIDFEDLYEEISSVALEGTRRGFHETSEENAENILRNGVKIITGRKDRTDPGDLGTGFYLSPDKDVLGEAPAILRVEFDDSQMAEFPAYDILWELQKFANDFDGCPEKDDLPIERYSSAVRAFLDINLIINEERCSIEFKTAQMGSTDFDRHDVAEKIRSWFIENGYTGIISDNSVASFPEIVIFDPDIVLDVDRVK